MRLFYGGSDTDPLDGRKLLVTESVPLRGSRTTSERSKMKKTEKCWDLQGWSILSELNHGRGGLNYKTLWSEETSPRTPVILDKVGGRPSRSSFRENGDPGKWNPILPPG